MFIFYFNIMYYDIKFIISVYGFASMLLDSTVKRKIIGEDLFGEIGELINFAKISSHQMKKIWTSPIFFQ